MTRKRTGKENNDFFGEHLEVKPFFMQKPKSLEEVMSAAFSTGSDHQASIEQQSTEKIHSTKDLYSTVAQPFVEPEIIEKIIDSTAAQHSSAAVNTTAEFSSAIVLQIPVRLHSMVTKIKKSVSDKWIAVEIKEESENYWEAYSQTWHWIEDNILSYLDKDSKLTLRRCYRKAYGNRKAGGKFFTGQTALAKEVGLSKRKIQDILEIFNQLGWVVKTAHFNQGGLKGTEYEMRIPLSAAELFERSSKR